MAASVLIHVAVHGRQVGHRLACLLDTDHDRTAGAAGALLAMVRRLVDGLR